MHLIIGEQYAREQIREAVGGGDLVSYLPHAQRRVVCGCFDPALNIRAPFEIDPAEGPDVTRYAKALVDQQSEVPVFLKRSPSAWEYVGNFRAVRYSTNPFDLYPHKPRRRDAVAVLYLVQSEDSSIEYVGDEPLAAIKVASEGRRALAQHFRLERSRQLVEAKRRACRAELGHLRCESCDLVESELPRPIGEGCFEVHHLVPLATRISSDITRLDDLAVLCANCHRMIHRDSQLLTVEQLRKLLGLGA